MSEKKVLCIPKNALRELVPNFEVEVSNLGSHTVVSLLAEAGPLFIPREQAEQDENYLQIIPYVTVAEAEHHRLLAYKRQGGGEARLEGKWSVGFGGHIDDTDCFDKDHVPFMNVLTFAAYREVFEELVFKNTWDMMSLPALTIVGLIYSGNFRDAGPVDRVHLGVAMALPVFDSTYVTPRTETGTAVEHAWLGEQQLTERYDDFELWSRHCLPSFDIDKELAEAASTSTNTPE